MTQEPSTNGEISLNHAVRGLLASTLNCPEETIRLEDIETFLGQDSGAKLITTFRESLQSAWTNFEGARVSDAAGRPDSPSPDRSEGLTPWVPGPPVGEVPQPPRPGGVPSQPTAPAPVARKVVVGKPLVLKNANAGKPFESKVLLPALGGAFTLTCEGAEAQGLSWQLREEEGKKLLYFSGTPSQHGEHTFIITLVTDQEEIQHQIRWVVNPDPKSLWKNLPSDTSKPFWKPDSDSKSLEVQGRRLVAASQRGRSHGHEGSCRDDDFQITYLEDVGWYLIAVADGAGSSKFSRRGAQVAVTAALKHMEDSVRSERVQILADALPKDGEDIATNREVMTGFVWEAVGNAAFTAYKAIERETESVPGSVMKDFATTLLLGAVKEFPGHGWVAMTYWVGDGGIGVYDAQGPSVKILGNPDEGEFAGQTRFLTMSDLWTPDELIKRLRIRLFPSFTGMIWMTDGITDPIFQTDNNLNDASRWSGFWDSLEQEAGLREPEVGVAQEKLLQWMDFWSQGNHDDRTLAVLY